MGLSCFDMLSWTSENKRCTVNFSHFLSSENVNYTSNAFARYWMGSHAYIVNECARTNHIVMMLRMPCKHSIWSGELDVSQENNFSPFVYSEKANNGWFLLPEWSFVVSQKKRTEWIEPVDTYVHSLFGKGHRLYLAQPEAGQHRRHRLKMEKHVWS